jgi:hypothetical protein
LAEVDDSASCAVACDVIGKTKRLKAKPMKRLRMKSLLKRKKPAIPMIYTG